MSLSLTYPGGKLRTLSGAAIAGNIETALSPGTGKRWIVQYGKVNLDTDATVADRRIFLKLDDGTDNLCNIGFTNAIIANKIGELSITPARFTSAFIIQAFGVDVGESVYLKDTILEGDDELQINIIFGVAGDAYLYEVRVLELGITP